MNINQRRQRVIAAIEILEEVVLDVLKPTQEEQLRMDGTPVENRMKVEEIATRAGIPAPSENALIRYVLRQLEKEGRVKETRADATSPGWQLGDYE